MIVTVWLNFQTGQQEDDFDAMTLHVKDCCIMCCTMPDSALFIYNVIAFAQRVERTKERHRQGRAGRVNSRRANSAIKG